MFPCLACSIYLLFQQVLILRMDKQVLEQVIDLSHLNHRNIKLYH